MDVSTTEMSEIDLNGTSDYRDIQRKIGRNEYRFLKIAHPTDSIEIRISDSPDEYNNKLAYFSFFYLGGIPQYGELLLVFERYKSEEDGSKTTKLLLRASPTEQLKDLSDDLKTKFSIPVQIPFLYQKIDSKTFQIRTIWTNPINNYRFDAKFTFHTHFGFESSEVHLTIPEPTKVSLEITREYHGDFFAPDGANEYTINGKTYKLTKENQDYLRYDEKTFTWTYKKITDDRIEILSEVIDRYAHILKEPAKETEK